MLVTFATLTCFRLPVQSAVTEAWVQGYSNVLSNSVDRVLKVVRDATGNIIFTGLSGLPNHSSGSELVTVKFSGADGSLIWSQRRGYDTHEGEEYAVGTPAAVDRSGNVVVTGSVYRRRSIRDQDCTTAHQR